MQFQTKHNRKQQEPEKNSGNRLTESAGYIPAKKRIENLMFAGLKLKEFRMEQFDFHYNQVDESYFDRTRSKNFDLADVSAMRRELEERAKKKREEYKQEQAEKALKEPLEARSEQKTEEKG